MSAVVPFAAAVPAPPAAITRILARHPRERLEAFVTVAIDLMDALDGDPDLEPEEDMGEEERGENRTWIETIDQRRIAAFALTYAEMDDDAEEDDPSGQCDEDCYTGPAQRGGGPGCSISDSGEIEDGL